MFWPNASLTHSHVRKHFIISCHFSCHAKKGLNNFYVSTRIISVTNTNTKRGDLAQIPRVESRGLGVWQTKGSWSINNESRKTKNQERTGSNTNWDKQDDKVTQCQQKVLQRNQQAAWKLIPSTCIHRCEIAKRTGSTCNYLLRIIILGHKVLRCVSLHLPRRMP